MRLRSTGIARASADLAHLSGEHGLPALSACIFSAALPKSPNAIDVSLRENVVGKQLPRVALAKTADREALIAAVPGRFFYPFSKLIKRQR